ncbi:MAG: zinc ribbon domain-containing protein [Calditrichaeota bacterium]|nr:zinc ribbon domain-containing protein [Calditrichota bacterium]MCB0302690.1 zinc ribbon domain-containing protein [Calditrichota bacterium]MCB9087195.1 zinc ribbon domain-containing protein [Calditrichia bacterium]
MPTYDYRCKACNHQFEAFQRMSDAPLSTCPECGGEVQRLISGGTGLIFKGSGFYITDYKDNSNGSSKKGEKKAGSDNSEPKASSKPDKTAESKSTEKAGSTASKSGE